MISLSSLLKTSEDNILRLLFKSTRYKNKTLDYFVFTVYSEFDEPNVYDKALNDTSEFAHRNGMQVIRLTCNRQWSYLEHITAFEKSVVFVDLNSFPTRESSHFSIEYFKSKNVHIVIYTSKMDYDVWRESDYVHMS